MHDPNEPTDLPAWNDPHNPRVCFCWKVHRDTLLAVIAAGARSLDDLANETRAGTGCGTCRLDLLALLNTPVDAPRRTQS